VEEEIHISEKLEKVGITEVLLSQGCRGVYIVVF